MRNGNALVSGSPHDIFHNNNMATEQQTTKSKLVDGGVEATAPLRLGRQETGTGQLSRLLTGTRMGEGVSGQTAALRRELEQKQLPEFIEGYLALRDALTGASSGEAGYRETSAPSTLVVVGDDSPSMNGLNLTDWGEGKLKGNKVIDAEDSIFGLAVGASAEFAHGIHGDVQNMFVLFSLPYSGTIHGKTSEDHDVDVILSEVDADPSRPGVIAGEVASNSSGAIAKVVKRRGFGFSFEEDGTGFFSLIRDKDMRGSGTYLAPSLYLLKQELEKSGNEEWAKAVREGKEAVIVLMVTDGEIHDLDQRSYASGSVQEMDSAKDLALQLANMGVMIVPIVIGGSSDGLSKMETLAPGNVIDNKKASKLPEQMKDLARKVASRPEGAKTRDNFTPNASYTGRRSY